MLIKPESKYLGVTLEGKGGWKKEMSYRENRARASMAQTWAMGIKEGSLSVKCCLRLWEALVRPHLEYAAEIWGDCEFREAESVQLEMGRRILRCPPSVTREVTGELGWRLQARRDYARLLGKAISSKDEPTREEEGYELVLVHPSFTEKIGSWRRLGQSEISWYSPELVKEGEKNTV